MKRAFGMWLLVALSCALVGVQTDCAPASGGASSGLTPKDVANVTVKVADEICKELSEDPAADPNWVKIACTVDAVGNVVNVLLPRAEWHAIKARRKPIDAGPGR